MYFPWTRVATFVALAAIVVIANTPLQLNAASNPEAAANWNAQVVKDRLVKLQLPVPIQSNEQVMTRIRQYVITGKTETEAILGRTNLYFPIFEHQLRAHGLPEELKFLPLIESGLLITIKSPVGATGVWQLMTVSARHFGLQVGSGVDERMDIYRSTEAAMKMLKFLHNKFGDWALVLAAYNSGAGKVDEAIRMAGTKDYWKVKEYLPKETQRYVPAFIAAAYVAKFHRQHNLQPSSMSYFTPELRTLRIYRRVTFGEISRVTGANLTLLARLNPAFVQGIVPESKEGRFLILPNEKATLALRDYLSSTEEKAAGKNAFRTTYVVSKGDNLEQVAKLFQTSVTDIMKWNKLNDAKIVVRQELLLLLPKTFLLNRA